MADNKKLASTIFKTGAKDDVLVNDAYKVKTDTPTNAITSTLDKLAKTALGAKLGVLSKGQELLGKVQSGLATAKGKVAAVRDKVKALKNSAAITKIRSGIKTAKSALDTARKQVGAAAAKVRQVRDTVQNVKNSVGNLKNSVKQFAGNVKNMGKDLKNAKANFIADTKNNIGGRLDNTLNFKKLGLGDLTDSARNEFSKNVALVQQTAKITTGGKTTTKSGNTLDSADVANSINAYTGKPDGVVVIDVEAERALASAIANDALNSGMEGAFPDIVEQVQNGASVNSVLLDAFPIAAKNSQTETVDYILTKMTGPQLRSGFPDATERVLKGFTVPEDKGADTWPTYNTALIATLDKIDENWWRSKRGEEEIIVLKPFQAASPVARDVLALDSRFEEVCMFAKEFDPRTFEQSVKDYYPFALKAPTA